jgi:hypothetical protein
MKLRLLHTLAGEEFPGGPEYSVPNEEAKEYLDEAR